MLDTAVMVAALRSDAGASRRLLRMALAGAEPKLLVSVPLMVEYEAVMTRPEHLEAARLTVEEVGMLLDAVASTAEPVRLAFLWRPILPDIEDDMVLEVAVNGRADGLVTFNRRHFAGVERQFGIPVSLPAEILVRLEEKK